MDKFWLAFYHLHDILSINIKFDNNRHTDEQTDRPTGRQTNRQTVTEDIFLRTLGVMKGRENVKVASLPTDSITILPER